MINESQFAELLGIVDQRAGRRHSVDGAVATTLREVLARHERMIVEHLGKGSGVVHTALHDR